MITYKVESVDTDTGLWEDVSYLRTESLAEAIDEALIWWPEAQVRVIDIENQHIVWEDGTTATH